MSTTGTNFVAVLSALVLGVQSQARTGETIPEEVQDAIVCLFREPWDELKRVVPDTSRHVQFRFTRGSIPGWPDDKEGTILNITIYSSNKKAAVLLFAEPQENRRLLVLRNGYTLKWQAGRWEAGEGNGGLATYRLIGEYADKLDRSPMLTTIPDALPEGVECAFER